VFEFDKFAGGSKSALDAAIEAAQKGSTVIIGGGDTATVVASAFGLRLRFYSPFLLCLTGNTLFPFCNRVRR
jgi:3-phosphoglycerate kinase